MGCVVVGSSEGEMLCFSDTGLDTSPSLSLVVLMHLFVIVPSPPDKVVLLFQSEEESVFIT